jgi:phenol 2-monooxygenase
VKYDSSALIGAGTHQALATGQQIGRRFHSAPVVRVADAMQMQLGHVAEADGRWRIYAFADKDCGAGSSVYKLSEWLAADPESPVIKYTPAGVDSDAVIDLRAIFQPGFDALPDGPVPALLRPEKGALALQDHEKIFCTDHKGRGDIFDMRGIDRAKGCMIVVRPDQYIAQVLPLDGYHKLAAFFDGVFLPLRDS